MKKKYLSRWIIILVINLKMMKNRDDQLCNSEEKCEKKEKLYSEQVKNDDLINYKFNIAKTLLEYGYDDKNEINEKIEKYQKKLTHLKNNNYEN